MDTDAPGPSSTLTHRDSGRSNNVIVLDSDEDSDDDIIISGESYRRPRKGIFLDLPLTLKFNSQYFNVDI